MTNWKDILSGEEEVNDEDLLKYLNGSLPEAEKQLIEQKLSSSDFANDAVEGLQEFRNKQDLKLFVDHLNKNLHKHLQDRKLKKEKRKIKEYPWIIIAIIIVLAICITGYVVIHIHNKNQQTKPAQLKTS